MDKMREALERYLKEHRQRETPENRMARGCGCTLCEDAIAALVTPPAKVLCEEVSSLNKEVHMLQAIKSEHRVDEKGNPAGGETNGRGITIHWQDGPLGRGSERKEPNGAFVEGVIAASVSRLEFYQSTQFKCRENAIALTHLETALLWLQKRTMDREAREVEGTHAQ